MPRRPQKGRSQSWLVHASNQNNHNFTMNSLNARQVDGNNVTANDELVAVNAIMLKRTAVADNAADANSAAAGTVAQDLAGSGASIDEVIDVVEKLNGTLFLTTGNKLRLFKDEGMRAQKERLGGQVGSVTNVTITNGNGSGPNPGDERVVVTVDGTGFPENLYPGDKITMGMVPSSNPNPTVNVAVPTIDAILDGTNDATVTSTGAGRTQITFDVYLVPGEIVNNYDATDSGNIVVSGTVAPASAGNDDLVKRQCSTASCA